MINSIQDRVQLNNGVQMPWLGLGVWLVRDEVELDNAIKAAIRTGYRAIDTAAAYYNEEGVGKAIRESDVPREELFITTKVWNVEEDYDTTLKNFEDSRKKLGLEYIDLYLIHWPGKRRYTETGVRWKHSITRACTRHRCIEF